MFHSIPVVDRLTEASHCDTGESEMKGCSNRDSWESSGDRDMAKKPQTAKKIAIYPYEGHARAR